MKIPASPIVIKVGDHLKDNDPRMENRGLLTVTDVLYNGVIAVDSMGRSRGYLTKRISLAKRRCGMLLIPVKT